MKIALIVVGVIAVAVAVFEFAGRIVSKRARASFDKMSPDEQRRHQEEAYKAQLLK